MPDEDARLLGAIEQLNESVQEAARRSATLDARIDALPGPQEIAAAVEAEVQRSVRNTRDEIDARVGSLGARLDGLAKRLAEVSDALTPLEGLRTEISTVADENAGLREIKARIDGALEQLSKTATRYTPETQAAEDDARFARIRDALEQTAAAIRSDFEVLVRGELQASERRSDALGLRITNLSLEVTRNLEALAGATLKIGERAATLEAENAAILQAVKEEVTAMSAGGADAVRARIEALDATFGSDTKAMLEGLAQSVDELAARTAELPPRIEAATPAEQPSLEPVLEQVAAARAALEEAVADIRSRPAEGSSAEADRVRAEIVAIVEGLGDQIVTRTAGITTQLTERATHLEDLISALPSPVADLSGVLPSTDDLAKEIGDRVAVALTETKREMDVRFIALEHELSGVATNVNEIWIRVRALVKGLDDERSTVHEAAVETTKGIGALSDAHEQLRARLLETEKGIGETMRGIETERDRMFLATLQELLEKLPRRERKLFRKRIEEIAAERADAVQDAAPQAPPQQPSAMSEPETAKGSKRKKRSGSAAKSGRGPEVADAGQDGESAPEVPRGPK